MIPENTYFGSFDTVTFADVWKDVAAFQADYAANQIDTSLTAAQQKQVYYLLYSMYGNSYTASTDKNQFKYQIFATIFQYGLTWAKKVEIQKTFRSLTESELMAGTKTIMNHANNPDTTPGTTDPEVLTYIDEQNVSGVLRGKLEAYNALAAVLEDDLTRNFLDKFKKFFLRIVYPQRPLLYKSDDGGDDND